MALKPDIYAWNPAVQDSQYQCLTFAWSITGAKTISLLSAGAPIATTFDAGLDTLAEITAALPNMTTDEFTAATAWGSTAMGTDAFGFVIDMSGEAGAATGQARRVRYVVCHVAGTASSVPLIAGFAGQTTALTNALTNQCTVGSLGNIGGHFVVTGLDALTTGLILLQIYVEMK